MGVSALGRSPLAMGQGGLGCHRACCLSAAKVSVEKHHFYYHGAHTRACVSPLLVTSSERYLERPQVYSVIAWQTLCAHMSARRV